ncbi:MAG TPA: PRC-barrel domain-containing protein [Anaerolineae bacterium]
MTHHTVQVLSTGTLKGTEVENAQGENLGHLEEVMLDLDTGRVAYAVLSFGGILGIGDKLFAVPWDALRIDTREERIILNVDKERLENAPGFDKDDWPETADPSWLNRVYSYYGYTYGA